MRKMRIIPALLLCLLLCGCGQTLALSGGEVSPGLEELSLVAEPEDLVLLDQMPNLRRLDLSGSRCYEEILAWGQAHPTVELRWTVQLPDGREIPNDETSLDLSALSGEQLRESAALLAYLPALERVELGGAREPALLRGFLEDAPALDCHYGLLLPWGTVAMDTEAISLPELDSTGIPDLAEALPLLPALRWVDLGEEAQPIQPEYSWEKPEPVEQRLSWAEIASLQRLRPDVDFSYKFRLYDRDFSTLDETMDLAHVEMDDQGEAVWERLPCMQHLKLLDMDSCGVDNEVMAAVRDQYPEVSVVWRVWFGDCYSARTDAIKILASNPGIGGVLMKGTYENLRYFTKCKYLDVGHQLLLDDISFVSYMPDLEVCIVAMGCWSDATPLASCPHLEFLEIQTTNVADLTPLSGLKELRHLNIGYDFELHDITPIMDLELERLWIGCLTPIPAEQVEEYRQRHPDCRINLEGTDPHYMWRWIGYDEEGNPVRDPRYDLLVEQFGYDREEYSFEWVEGRGW